MISSKPRPRKDARLGGKSVQDLLHQMLQPGRRLGTAHDRFILYGVDGVSQVCHGSNLTELAEAYLAIRARDVLTTPCPMDDLLEETD